VKSLSVRGTELWYVDRGSGIPLLLVHGFPLDHAMWVGQIDALGGRTPGMLVGEAFMSAPPAQSPPAPKCRVIAPDLRGFGRSGRNGNDKVTMDQFADDLAGLLDALAIDEPVILCGLSMGGYIAFQFWKKYPARLRGLILCDTRASADSPEAAAGRLSMADRVLREGPAPLVEAMMPRLFAETTRRQHPQMVQRLQGVMMASDPVGIAAAARGMVDRPDMTAVLGQIRCPTLVIVGQSDAISPPAEMRGIAEAIPGAQFTEIPAAGHMAPLENAPAVNAAIAGFLFPVL
jgi:3-oxoadipate enol-lactonase